VWPLVHYSFQITSGFAIWLSHGSSSDTLEDIEMHFSKSTVNLAEIRREYHQAEDGDEASRLKKR
jgi:hypothetical protein